MTQVIHETGRAQAWAACNALRECRREVGISTGALHSLQAILSFIVDQGSPIVHAANRTICDRASCCDRTLRRHLAELERHGIIRRAASANGKRFRLRNPDGPDMVFGIDVTPLLTRLAEFSVMAEEIRDRMARLRLLRHRISSALARQIEAGTAADDEEAAELRRYLRRARDVDALARIAETLEADQAELSETSILSGSSGQNVRHIQDHQKEEILMSPSHEREKRLEAIDDCCEELGLQLVAERCPDAMSFAIAPVRNADELRAFGWSLGSMAGIPERLMHQAAARSGLDAVILAVLAIVQRGAAIRNAPGYFRTLFFGPKAQEFSPWRMIKGLSPAVAVRGTPSENCVVLPR